MINTFHDFKDIDFFKQQKQYNPFQCPADLDAAVLHGQSQRVCKPLPKFNEMVLINSEKKEESKINTEVCEVSKQNNQIDCNKEFETLRKVEQSLESQIKNSNNSANENAVNFSYNHNSQCISDSKQNHLSLSKEVIVESKQQIPVSQQQIVVSKQSVNKIRYCYCCGYAIDNEQYELKCQTEEFLHLGMTYPLYFDFIKQCAILLICELFISSLPALVTNLSSDQCHQYNETSFICQLTFLNVLEKGEKTSGLKEHALSIQNLCNMIFLIVSMVLISIFKIQQKIKKNKLQKNAIFISDFSVFITNLPNTFFMKDLHSFLKEKLMDEFQNLGDNFSLEVIKEYRLYDLKEYANLYQKKVEINQQMIKMNKKIKQFQNQMESSKQSQESDLEKQLISSTSQLEQLQETLQQIDRQIQQMEVTILQYDQQKIQFSHKAIITLNDFQTVQKLRQCFKMTFKQKLIYSLRSIFPTYSSQVLKKFIFNGNIIKVANSPQPSDIIFANIGSNRSKWKYILISYISVYFLVFVSFLILLTLKKSIQQEQSGINQIVSLLLSFSSSAVVAIFNSLLGICIRKGANYEEHDIQTSFFVSVGNKLTKMFIINMVVSTLASNMVHFYIISEQNSFPFDAPSLMGDFFFLFITNSYIGSIFNLFDIFWGVRLLKRRSALKDNSTLTQMEANSLFEGHPIDMALRYANVNKTVLFTAAVSPFIPIGVPLSIVGLIVTYWVDKYLLLRRYVCKNQLSFQLSKKMLNSFKIFTVFFSFGNMLTMFMPVSEQEATDAQISHFKFPNRKDSPYFYLSILGFLISIVFRYFPLKGLAYIIYNLLFKDHYSKRIIYEKYTDIAASLSDDYDAYHPIFKDKKNGQIDSERESQNYNKNVEEDLNDDEQLQQQQQLLETNTQQPQLSDENLSDEQKQNTKIRNSNINRNSSMQPKDDRSKSAISANSTTPAGKNQRQSQMFKQIQIFIDKRNQMNPFQE